MLSHQNASVTTSIQPLTPQQVEKNFTRLRHMQLWEQMPDGALRALAAVARPERYDQNVVLFRDDDPGDKLYFLCSGAVEFYLTNAVGTHIPLEVKKGEGFFGEVAALEGKRRTATARAIQDTETLAVSRIDLLKVLHDHPDLMITMYKETARRLGRTSANLRKTNIRNVNDLAPDPKEQQNWEHRLARFCGSLKILYWNALAVGIYGAAWAFARKNPLDGVPFNLLALLVGLEAIVITCVVLNSQYRQETNDRLRNEEQFHANMNSEKAILELHERVRTLSAALERHLPPRPFPTDHQPQPPPSGGHHP